jgi:acetoin utilization deacetylase AcuC-like enzyme
MRIFTHADCQRHIVPAGFPECPRRWEVLDRALSGGPWDVERETDGEVDRRLVEGVHEAVYLERFAAAVRRGDAILDTPDNPISAGSWEAAWAAAGVALRAAEWVAAGGGRRAFAMVRPPGHHAERDSAMGFCYLNNIAIAAHLLVDRLGVERLAIVDFDVHHGNGTQHTFEDRAEVLFASLHQYPFYPGTGAARERGVGAGVGATLNVPLPAGTGEEAYFAAFEEQVRPAVEAHRPQVLLASAGFDAWKRDPLGGLRLGVDAFRRLGRELASLADRLCDGRLLSVLEGGYDLEALPGLVTAFLEAQADADLS